MPVAVSKCLPLGFLFCPLFLTAIEKLTENNSILVMRPQLPF